MAEAVDVEALARACAPIADGRVEHLRRLSGGASRETWTFDLVDAGGRSHALVLRRDPGANVGHSERATEYVVLQAAAAGGVPVPAVRVLLVPDHGLGTGFVMDRGRGRDHRAQDPP
jgi:aminoglycoside phosphotransferase (APT) family kinase protein